MKEYTIEQIKNIIVNCQGWIDHHEKALKQYDAWGASWANSSFAFDEKASLIKFRRTLKAAEHELARR